MVSLNIALLEFLAYICLFALFIIIFANTFYLCLLFNTLQPPSDPDAPDDPIDPDDPDEDFEDIENMIDDQTLYVVLFLFYLPERVPYKNQKIQKIGLMSYQRKKRPKWVIPLINSLSNGVKIDINLSLINTLSNEAKIYEIYVKDNIGENVVKDYIRERVGEKCEKDFLFKIGNVGIQDKVPTFSLKTMTETLIG